MTTSPDGHFDFAVIVLGGGPAGTATALALKRRRPGLAVAIIERSGYSTVRIGETLHPGVETLLRQLGAWEEVAAGGGHLPAYGTRALWGSGEPVENEFLYHRNGRGWHLDRRRFDEQLAGLAERQGVALLTRSRVVHHTRERNGWHLVLEDGRALTSKVVVDATGRGAAFARSQGAHRVRFDRLVGLFLFATLRPGTEMDSYTLVEASEEGWWYSSRLPDGGLVFALMTDPDVIRRRGLRSLDNWLAEARRTDLTAERLALVEPGSRLTAHAAGSQQLDRVTGDGWLAVGDAVLAFDPLSSGGIFQALRSGLFAARAIADLLEGDSSGLAKYESFLAAELDGYLAARTDYYGRERRWPGSPFWQRRQEAINLDPQRVLLFDETAGTPSGLYLSPEGIALLCDLCRSSRAAYQVVAAFKERYDTPAPDRRIVMALQDLVERGVLVSD